LAFFIPSDSGIQNLLVKFLATGEPVLKRFVKTPINRFCAFKHDCLRH